MPAKKPITPSQALAQARKNSTESQIRARLKRDHMHENEIIFLRRIVETVDYMRSQKKSELEIAKHLNVARKKHELLEELLRN
jgi:hypothetical protein